MPGSTSSALTPLGGDDPGDKAQGRAVRTLATLMRDIAERRAHIHRKESLVVDLESRLLKDLGPLESQLIAARLEVFRVLGRHLRDGWLSRKAAGILRQAVAALADEIESEYDIDLGRERSIYLGEDEVLDKVMVKSFSAEREAYLKRQAAAGGENESVGESESDPGYGEGDEAAYESRQGRGDGRHGTRSEGRPHSKAAKKRAEKDLAIAGDIRALYLILARALHPDKEPNPALREAKTVWMQKVTTAYAKRDLAMLLDILARNPLEAVGPYLSQAPLKTVQGFAKRLRRELAALKLKAERSEEWLHPFLARFLKGNGMNEAAINRHLTELKKTVKVMKQRRDVYRTREGVAELIEGLKIHPWWDLL